MRNREREELFAQLTVQLFEFNHNLPFVNLHGAFSFQPTLKTLEVDRGNSAGAVARGNQGIESAVVIYFF